MAGAPNFGAPAFFASSFGENSPVSAGEFTPKEEAKKNVILSASEISHDQSEKYILCGNPPSREIAAVAMLPRNDK